MIRKTEETSLAAWTSILSISTRFRMSFIRSEAISAITNSHQPIDPVDQIVLAVTHYVPDWLPVAYTALCCREKSITGEEGVRLGVRTALRIAEARERLRDTKLKRLGVKVDFDVEDVESTVNSIFWSEEASALTPEDEDEEISVEDEVVTPYGSPSPHPKAHFTPLEDADHGEECLPEDEEFYVEDGVVVSHRSLSDFAIENFSKSGAPNPFSMGNFGAQGNKMSSEERFALANSGRAVSMGGPADLPFGCPLAMTRTPGQDGHPSNRTNSEWGEKRGDANKPQAIDSDPPVIVDRKVKALLNKLTMKTFDSISDQIITWANKSETEKDGRTLIQIVRLVFEKATDGVAWSEMCARLCQKMMEQISPKVQDDDIKNFEGKPIAGGQLFRKYLLNRCQMEFERGWAAKDAVAAKAFEDDATKAANRKNKDGDDEPVLHSDEYYASQKARRQGLALIKFIGELFKLQMLTERIMHECIKKLLGNDDHPEGEEIESLCELLSTVGALLDTNKARVHMDVYFSHMRELTKSGNVNSRMQLMLQVRHFATYLH